MKASTIAFSMFTYISPNNSKILYILSRNSHITDLHIATLKQFDVAALTCILSFTCANSSIFFDFVPL